MNAVVTVPYEHKWYHLWITEEDGAKRVLSFEEIEATVARKWDWSSGSVLGDHIVHPRAVQMYAAMKGMTLDPLSHELLVGRWVLEWPGCDRIESEMIYEEEP